MKHTPEPWKQYRSDSHFAPRFTSDWIIESDTRKGMAMLTVCDINSNPKWRAEHPEVLAEHAETLLEVEANAKRIVACVNACAGIENPAGLSEALKVLHDMSTGSVSRDDMRGLATHALNALRAATADGA